MSANVSHAVLRRDIGNIRMDLAGVEKVDVAAVSGADRLTVNDLAGTDVRYVNLDLSSQGAPDQQADTAEVNGTNRAATIDVDATGGVVTVSGLRAQTSITGADVTDQLDIKSGGGNDTVQVSDAPSALFAVGVDLGTGQR